VIGVIGYNQHRIIPWTSFIRGVIAVSVISAPSDWVESVSKLRLPTRADRRLSELMDRNNEGQLNADELAELEALVEMSEELSLVRAEAIRLLGRKPA
jgi:hypothetical protein